MRYALQGGGKRIRPVLCLATGEAAGAEPADLLPAAAAIELVHTFSLVHDDLPALDDDALRRGRASAHVEYGEAVAILAGDALLAQALDLALSYGRPEVARELARATLGMIGGQYLDVTNGRAELAQLHALKTGRLFSAAVGSALWVARVPEESKRPGGTSRPTSGSSSRSWTTCSTVTGSCRSEVSTVRGLSPTRRRSAPGLPWPRFLPTRPAWTSSFRA